MKVIVKFIVGLFFIVASNQVMAWTSEAGSRSVSNLRFAADGLYVRLKPAPASCGGGDQYRMHAMVPATAANYKQLTAALLTAYTSNQLLSNIWVSNEGFCSSTQILVLDMVEFLEK